MLTVIDHAIAIPARPQAVWDIIRDITRNPLWQSDSQRVQFLTTTHHGRSTRWRSTSQSKQEQVFEITAWYEGLGYEYRIVDGTQYDNNRGRIRLQESPEGTIVQWSFSYDLGGMFSNLKNNLGLKGRADKHIVTSLRQLYTHIKETKGDENLIPEQSKTFLKQAPNVQERASYEPRHPSKTQEVAAIDPHASFKPPITTSASASATIIDEPPLSDEDTRPNPSVATSPTLSEPSFLQALPKDVDPLPMLEQDTRDTGSYPAIEPDEDPLATIIEKRATVQPVLPSATSTSEVSKLDTAEVSVFEVFGLEKPSDTQKGLPTRDAQSNELIIPEPPRSFMDSAPIIPDVQPERHIQRRRGLRASMRSQLKQIRVPKYEEQ